MRLIILEDGTRVFSPSLNSVILPVGPEPIKDIDLSDLTPGERDTIKNNIDRDEIVNPLLSKLDENTSLADSGSIKKEEQ